MQEFISTFHIDWRLMLAQIVNFGLVFLVFYFLAAKPLRKLVENRTQKIEMGLKDAKENKVLLEKTKSEYEETIIKARREAEKIFKDGKKEAEMKRAEMLEEAKKEVESMIASGKKSLEAKKAKTVEEAKREIAGLAILAAEKILSSKEDLDKI